MLENKNHLSVNQNLQVIRQFFATPMLAQKWGITVVSFCMINVPDNIPKTIQNPKPPPSTSILSHTGRSDFGCSMFVTFSMPSLVAFCSKVFQTSKVKIDSEMRPVA